MARVELDVPDDREADVLAAVAQELASTPTPPPDLAKLTWTKQLAEEVVGRMRPAERMLVFRLAEARQRRVPVSELTRDFGLAPGAALSQDFPALTVYCAERNAALPITTGGHASDAWYWMSAAAALCLRGALTNGL